MNPRKNQANFQTFFDGEVKSVTHANYQRHPNKDIIVGAGFNQPLLKNPNDICVTRLYILVALMKKACYQENNLCAFRARRKRLTNLNIRINLHAFCFVLRSTFINIFFYLFIVVKISTILYNS